MNAAAQVGAPGSKNVLERRISEYARTHRQTDRRVRITISQTVVAQMMPDALIKGGSGMKFRLGMAFARDSKDLDAAWRADHAQFVEALETNLRTGWGPFSGTVKAVPPRHGEVAGYPGMRPNAVRLSVYRRDFQTVTVEVGWDELGATQDGSAELASTQDIGDMFVMLGLPRPKPVRIIAVHHQIAQKIHACTEPGSERAHDLVDLQLLWPEDEVDLTVVATTTRRQFEWRRKHAFPGVCTPTTDWEGVYREAAAGLDVRATVAEAAEWLNERLVELASR